LSSAVSLASQVNSSPKLQRAIPSWSAVFQFEFPGPDFFHLIIDQGQWQVRAGAHIRPTVALQCEEVCLPSIFSGEIDISHLIARGKIKIAKGPYLEAINLSRVALAARRERQRGRATTAPEARREPEK
jgi:hypothetical protein